MKPLYLLSFSLTFLTQGIANDFSYEESREQFRSEENAYDQEISFDGGYLSDAEQQGASMQSSSDQLQDCLSPFHRMHVSARHNESKGIGYHDGYTTIEAFGIYDGWSSHFMPFLDLRGHVFNNGKLAGNLGIGERTLMSSINHTFGSYLYYDVRRVGHGLTVNQLSPGLELVGKRMEYRINGYFPVGKDEGRKYDHKYKFDAFEGNSILLKSKFKQYHAMRGGDAEVGVHVTQSTKYDLYAAAGPYYFQAPHNSSWGGRTRLLGRYKEYVSLEVAYSYDHLFHSVVQGNVALTLPFGRKLKRSGQGCPQSNDLLLSRASFAPSRFEIPVVKKLKKHGQKKAINPATGKPWTVWFVDNTSSSSGTFESPFTTIAAASAASSPNDMIYVFPGNAQYNEQVVLQNGQAFFGSGIKQRLATTKGTMVIPAFSSSIPSITSGAGPVVSLANNNIVSGFNIVNPGTGYRAIAGVGTNGATIINNILDQVTNGGGYAIDITGFGTMTISNNQIFGIVGTNDGISLTPSSGSMDGVVNNNSISGFIAGLALFSGSGSYNLTIEGNTFTDFNDSGPDITMSNSSMINLIGNTFVCDGGGDGITIRNDSTTLSGRLNIKNNQIFAPSSGGSSYGINVIMDSSALSPLMHTVISNNFVQSDVGSGFAGIRLTATDSTTICLDLDDNTVAITPGATAYSFSATAPGVINIESIDTTGSNMTSTGTVNFVPKGTCGN